MSIKDTPHYDIICELLEFAEMNWSGFTTMLNERGYDGDPEQYIDSLREELYS